MEIEITKNSVMYLLSILIEIMGLNLKAKDRGFCAPVFS
jgi:hypothetical protein